MSEPIAQTRQLDRQGMVTLRGDLSAPAFQEAVRAATGHDVPDTRGFHGQLGAGVAWMSPDELLLLCDADKAPELAGELTKALADTHHLAVDVSDARAVFEINGPGVREVVAKLAPMDMAPGAFEPGQIRRTRLAQIPAAIWMADAQTIYVVCFGSVAQYAHDLLHTACQAPLALNGWSG